MASDLFLMSFNIKLVPLLFLSTLFAIINLSWIFLFVISIRSYFQTPLMTIKETCPIYQVSRRRLPFVSIIVPARNEQDNIEDMKKYRITPAYSLLSFLGAGFIVISYIANIISLLSKQSISWRGRTSIMTYSNEIQSH
jgi:hypothetical protein